MHQRTAILVIVFLLVTGGCGAPAAASPTPMEQEVGPTTVASPASLPSPVPTDTPTPAPSPTLPDPAPTNSAQAVQNVAAIIYDALAAGEDLNPYINGVMTAFGVPPLGEADVTLAGTRFNQGLPLMFIPQVAELADAFNDGGFVSLDSFITAANNQGAKQSGTDNPLTREYLTQKFADYAGEAQYEPDQVLPAFVLALGKQRAARFPPKNIDPLWSDGLLDPLQFTLLLYSVSYSGAGPVSSQAPLPAGVVLQDTNVSFVNGPIRPSRMASVAGSDPIGDFIKDQIQGEVEGAVQGVVEVPLDKVEAAQVSVCASLLLYGHKMKVTTTPNLIYHNDGSKPWSTRVDVTLTFQDDYWDNYLPIDRWMLENLGNCKLPRRGTVEGKPLEWSVSDGLSGHGNFNVTPSQTDGDGKASANWQTVPETTPEDQRTFDNQRDAVGAVIVRAGSLVPGWSGLERIVGLLKDTGNTGDSPLTVIYYISQSYRVDGVYWDVYYLTGTICSLDKSFTLNADANPISAAGAFVFSPAAASSGAWSYNGLMEGLMYNASSTYQIEGVAEGAPVIVMNLGSNWSISTPAGTFPLGGGSHLAGGSERIKLDPAPEACGQQ